ncbi:MAG TPA: DEAD/DEAH box helicase [Gaiellaceae bacterium]
MSQSFTALGVSEPLVRVLTQRNIHSPFAVQELALPDALAGLDILAQSPTGSGKTLAFGLPLVERTAAGGKQPGALVLVPTRELATQVAADLKPLAAVKGLRITAVYGGTSVGQQAKAARSAHILIATPGRLNDLLERRMVSLDGVRVLVLDEADRMLDMGFQPQVDRILSHVPTNRQTMLFSATLEGPVDALAQRYTNNASRFRAELPAERRGGDIEHQFVAVTNDDKLDRLVEHLRGDRGLTLVFVRTKHGADKLVKKLSRHDVAATAMHGNMSQNQRERSLSRFESGKVSTLVATDVAARGLDIDDITHVINFDPPHGDEDYVHRVGRTGRAGRSGTGVTFVLPEQQTDVGKLASRLGHGDTFAASGMRVTKTSSPRPQARRQRRRGR